MCSKRSSLFAIIAFALGASASCSRSLTASEALADGTPDFQTDSASYTLRSTGAGYEGTIGVTFTNRTNATASFVNCRGGTGLRLELLVDGHWTAVWSPVLLACLSPPIVVASGGQLTTAIHIFAGEFGSNLYPQFSVKDIPGTYRAVWTAVVANYTTDGQGFGDLLPLEHRTSNTFTLGVGR